jgi:NAD(P)-dependent dehydrogenase (short-subunit alcohol dehydrogenase family)
MTRDADRESGRESGRRTVIVAGATARTAETVLRTFLDAGYHVAALARDEAKLEAQLERLNGADRLLPAIADLRDPAQVERAVAAAIEQFGRIDAAVDLAQSGAGWKPFIETTLDDLKLQVAGSLFTAYTLCRAVLPPMLAQGEGYIVTVAGGSALDPGHGRALFGACKAAIVTMTKGIARDHKAQGIRANCLVAGGIATQQARQYMDEDDYRAAVTLQEFADALLYLASPGASGLSGAVVEVNGREVE